MNDVRLNEEMSRHGKRPVALRARAIGRKLALMRGVWCRSRNVAKLLVWMFRYSTGFPAALVARRMLQSNVLPVRSTEAIASSRRVVMCDKPRSRTNAQGGDWVVRARLVRYLRPDQR
ncbi:MAG: hypothetical protein EBY93_00755 [Actinobacteria bacterium]|nr:hypothetical protein [Actinomycetota bacterium]